MRTRTLLALGGTAAALVPLALGAAPAAAAAPPPTPASHALVVERGHRDVRVPVTTRTAGETLLDLTVSAPGTDWARKGRESAVASVFVDGRYATDVVATGRTPVARQFQLGRLAKGRHVLRLHFASDRSAAVAKRVRVTGLRVRAYGAPAKDALALRYAPILYGRNLAAYGDAFQSARTDTPLVAWHEATPATTPGHTLLTYSVIWSNEDGGTDTPALMSRWGRTTDIEWVYAVEVDAHGKRVAGSDTYQAPNHQTLPFAGRYEGDHAVLETCTSNNNMCDTTDDPMRFFLSSLQTRKPSLSRESVMDANPWTYQVMAAEMAREGKIEPPGPGTPSTPEISDQRNYLFTVVKKTTNGVNDGDSWIGVALGVTLRSGRTVYLSNHGEADWSAQRDDPAATTVELPAGTKASDVATVRAYRVVVGTDTGASVDVTALQRGFLLGRDDRPGRSFVSWSGRQRLTASRPSAVLWRA